MEIATIGFTRRTAQDFFDTLRRAGIQRLVDVRRRNTSQLAGFAKRDDLAFFVEELVGADYQEAPLLAPTDELLDAYRGGRLTWPQYEAAYRRLLDQREVHRLLDRALFETPAVLLCSEHSAARCHRRLAVEHLAAHWGDVTPVHL
jgi:uncharacterized protein (DUF488 family)